MAAILNFRILPKMENHKFASISLTVRERAILSKFSTHRLSKKCTNGNFQKLFLSPKLAAILNFWIFAKNGKTQICFYLLNRARWSISSKFSTHRVSNHCTLGNFQKLFLFSKNGGHFEFSHFCQKWKNKFASISLTVRDRAISSKFSTHRVSKKFTNCNFQKKILLPKNGGHFEFSNFCQIWKNANFLLSP